MKKKNLTRITKSLQEIREGKLEGGFQEILAIELIIGEGSVTNSSCNNCNGGNCVAGCGSGSNGTCPNNVAGCGTT